MGARPSRRSTQVAAFWVGIGLALFALQALWSLSIPLIASPDEASHVIRAAAVVRGQWSGELGAAPTDASAPGSATTVRLPAAYADAASLPNCFAFHPDQPASCQQAVTTPDGPIAPAQTFAGQYPPLYYALVGWPSRFLTVEQAIYAMRIVSSAISAALLAWGAWRFRATSRPAAATWATVVAITPMVLFMGATVNPQALEISAAVAFWAACLALATAPAGPTTATFVQAAVAGTLLVNSRSSGPPWALVVVAVALALAPRHRLRALWAAKAMRWTVAAGAAASLAAVSWLATHGGVVTGDHLYPQYANPVTVVRSVLGATNQYVQQMIGDFGWLDAPSPALTVTLWSVAAGALLLLGLAVAPTRRRWALVIAAVAVVLAPVALQIPTAVNTGIIWQGRYTLPIAVGVPMVAAVVLTSGSAEMDETVRRIARWIVPAIGAAHVAAFWWAARRYAVGLHGGILARSPAWSSPIGYLSAVAVYAVVVGLVGGVTWWSLRPARREEASDSAALPTEAVA